MKVDVRLTGVSALTRKLLEAEPKQARKAMRKGINRGAIVLRDEAKNSAPVRSGALRKSIGIRRSAKVRGKRGWVAMAVVGPRRKYASQHGEKTVEPAKYAHLVEYGHAAHPAPPHPFMRPAYERTKMRAMQIYEDELRRAMAELRG